MDEKRTGLAVLISICAILLYSELVMDPYIKQGADARAAAALPASKAAAVSGASQGSIGQDSIGQTSGGQTGGPATQVTARSTAGSGAFAASGGVPSLAVIGASGDVVIENSSVVAKISLLGGRFSSYQLKDYKRHFGAPELVEMVTAIDGTPLPLGVTVGKINDASVLYSADKSADASSVLLSGQDLGTGIKFKKSISLAPEGYLSAVDVEVTGSDAPVSVEWNHFVSASDSHARLNPVSFKVMSNEDKLTNTLAGSLPTESEHITDPHWIGFGDRYFLAALIPNRKATGVFGDKIVEQHQDGSHLFSVRIGETDHADSVKLCSVKLYGGPKKAEVLAEALPGLERAIDLGWFSFLAFPLLGALKILHAILNNWGLAIVALTLVLKALFLPLTKASFGSMKAMQALQPEMKEMRERIKDPAVLNQEMLKLYQKHKVNPMGGCLPVLLQVPVFIGLYNVLLNAIELRHAPFALWVQDLSSPEALVVGGLHVPLMVLILGVSMFFQQYFTPSAGLDPTQRKVMLFMPLVLTGSFLIYPLPAGLVLYWVVNNTISIVQQVFLRTERRLNPYQATAIAGGAMFVFAVILTRL